MHAERAKRRVSGLLLCSWLAACTSSGTTSRATTCDQGWICRDSDCDTICDIFEGDASRDSDHDGVPDYLDTDSDGDGIPDHEEAGDDDPATPPLDRDRNSILDYLDPAYPLRFGYRDASMDAAAPSDASMPDSGSSDPTESAMCPSSRFVATECARDESGDAACDGLDNDCDGRVDNDNLCECRRGSVRNCFAGPPGRQHVGACQDGRQVCEGEAQTHWGECRASVVPEVERCDGLDNDCNGCRDDISGCASKLSCPAPHDPRTPDPQPFATYALDATRFYDGRDATGYHWFIQGSPCDRLFAALDPSATAQSGKQSFTLMDANTARTQALFTLSGAYEVTLVIDTPTGELRCDWVVHVRAPGLRVELCWDKTGPTAQADAVDLDVHLGKYEDTSAFSQPNDCYWATCRGDTTPWGYLPTSPISLCSGPAAQNYASYQLLGFCPNPRLDADNRLDMRSRSIYVTENINLDNPRVGDRFRVAVEYRANVLSDADADRDGGPGSTVAEVATHPIVNIYCGGELQGSLGGDPELRGDSEELTLAEPGAIWRAADVTVSDTGCMLEPLSDPRKQHGYWVTEHDSSYDGAR